MKKSELKEAIKDFGYQFLEQITTDISKVLFEVQNKNKDISLSCFINTLNEELDRRDQLEKNK